MHLQCYHLLCYHLLCYHLLCYHLHFPFEIQLIVHFFIYYLSFYFLFSVHLLFYLISLFCCFFFFCRSVIGSHIRIQPILASSVRTEITVRAKYDRTINKIFISATHFIIINRAILSPPLYMVHYNIFLNRKGEVKKSKTASYHTMAIFNYHEYVLII